MLSTGILKLLNYDNEVIWSIYYFSLFITYFRINFFLAYYFKLKFRSEIIININSFRILRDFYSCENKKKFINLIKNNFNSV